MVRDMDPEGSVGGEGLRDCFGQAYFSFDFDEGEVDPSICCCE